MKSPQQQPKPGIIKEVRLCCVHQNTLNSHFTIIVYTISSITVVVVAILSSACQRWPDGWWILDDEQLNIHPRQKWFCSRASEPQGRYTMVSCFTSLSLLLFLKTPKNKNIYLNKTSQNALCEAWLYNHFVNNSEVTFRMTPYASLDQAWILGVTAFFRWIHALKWCITVKLTCCMTCPESRHNLSTCNKFHTT